LRAHKDYKVFNKKEPMQDLLKTKKRAGWSHNGAGGSWGWVRINCRKLCHYMTFFVILYNILVKNPKSFQWLKFCNFGTYIA